MILRLRYTENKFEKPERCGYSLDFTEKVTNEECACNEPLPLRTKRHLKTIPWGKRYFGFEKCAFPGQPRARASNPTELRYFERKQCCGCLPNQ